MNKTVNINLAGIFFHIDEDAYGKLQRYIAAIRRSFAGVQGEDEIIADIEGRIAELFNERITEPRQVIRIQELDEVITIMGQPEDYAVDEDIFEDSASGDQKNYSSSRPGTGKKLYRDADNAYIGGVSSGFGHYFNIDPLWIRLLWVGLVIAGFGAPVVIYILLWVLVPEASTTADKLEMKGKAVNIDNIQQKVKESFDAVADSVKNTDFGKYGNQAKKGAGSFFSGLGATVMFLLRAIGKLIGVLLIIIGAATVIGLFVGLFTTGTLDLIGGEIIGYADILNTTTAPVWLVSLLFFFAIGTPFFFLFYLGLRIVSNNLKVMPLAGRLGLSGLWLVSIVALSVLGIKQATDRSFRGKTKSEKTLAIQKDDTLRLAMRGDDTFDINLYRSNDFVMQYDKDGERILLTRDVRLIVRSTDKAQAYLLIEKRADGPNAQKARDKADAISYTYAFENKTLELDGFLTTAVGNKYLDQEVRVTLYLPEGALLIADENTNSYHRNTTGYGDILDSGMEETLLRVTKNRLICSDCPEDDIEESSSEFSNEDSDWEQRNADNYEKPDWEDDDSN